LSRKYSQEFGQKANNVLLKKSNIQKQPLSWTQAQLEFQSFKPLFVKAL